MALNLSRQKEWDSEWMRAKKKKQKYFSLKIFSKKHYSPDIDAVQSDLHTKKNEQLRSFTGYCSAVFFASIPFSFRI